MGRPWASSVSPPSGPTSTAVIATTAVVAGSLGVLASAAYFHYRYGRPSPSLSPSLSPSSSLSTAGPLHAGTLQDGGDTARHLPSSFSGADATPSHAGGSCSYCGAIEGAACALRSPKADPYDPRPREGYLSWDDYFMALAFLSSQRSKDPNKQVGAVIVSADQIILGIGYNGFPRGCHDDQLPWAKRSVDGDVLSTKYPYVCHAEMNAIMNKNTAALTGSSIYVTLFPCNSCAKLLIQAGIKEVIFFEDKNIVAKDPAQSGGSGIRPDQAYVSSKRMLAMTGVNVRQHRPRRPICI